MTQTTIPYRKVYRALYADALGVPTPEYEAYEASVAKAGDGIIDTWDCHQIANALHEGLSPEEAVEQIEADNLEREQEARMMEYDDPEASYDYDGSPLVFKCAGSALRAATPSNPRNLPCPTCGQANRLTPKDRALGYQCDSCADRAERGYDY